jgi:hypothetical protein
MDKKAPKLSKAEQDYQKNVSKSIKSAYESGLQYLGGQEQRLQAFQPQVEQQIAQTFESQVPQIQEQLRQQTAGIRGQQEETRAQRESALASARRQYQEGTQRTQQLFGGVAGSSAGQAQSELLAREQARQMGATTRQAQTGIAGLEENLRNVQATTSQALRQVEQEKQSALIKARDQFRQQLDTINSQRFQLAQDKANKQLTALQDFNARRRQLEDYYTQQQDAIANYRTQQQIGLETYGQQLQLAQKYTPSAVTGGISNLAGLSLSALNLTNPEQAKTLAQQIASSPASVQQSYGATVSPDGTKLQFVDTVTKQFGEIPIK